MYKRGEILSLREGIKVIVSLLKSKIKLLTIHIFSFIFIECLFPNNWSKVEYKTFRSTKMMIYITLISQTNKDI